MIPGLRPQYHFRPSPEGLRAWNVQRLIARAKGLAITRVPLADIAELNEPYWSHEGTPELTCCAIAEHARLISECDLTFPILLSSDGRVMDGMHRVCKAFLEGRQDILVIRFEETPSPDFVGIHPDDLPYD